jgi:hypothetical protein
VKEFLSSFVGCGAFAVCYRLVLRSWFLLLFF